jgi:hypothetical protein
MADADRLNLSFTGGDVVIVIRSCSGHVQRITDLAKCFTTASCSTA